MAEPIAAGAASSPSFDLAVLSDVGTDRPDNEDACGDHVEDDGSGAIFVVADGIGGYEGGEIASRMAVDITLEAYHESPRAWGPAKRLHRAVQRANIEIHNRALTVPELRRMGTTLTAAVVEGGRLSAAHVGDCRLYLVRGGRIVQITKDHTMVAERVRMGLMSAARARNHPERSVLSRCLGHELIVAVDRIAMPLVQGDHLLLCSDGLYNVLDERELARMVREGESAAAACQALIEAANAHGTADNLTAAVFRMNGATPYAEGGAGWRARLGRLFGRSA
ncbi:MAG TPA: protein phosphatase 2C domain-containing protein [Candidatus Binataceae bacterium]|jgi:protein phosphatase|nr:protein phosphatase 2C domain-containing protein [Candidatus Binataceae bacterium]